MEDKASAQAAIHFLSTMKEAKQPFNLFVYPGVGHGYPQPLFNEGKNYNLEAVRTTWVIAEDFLNSNLRP
jgi:acetyl esterase/lipase